MEQRMNVFEKNKGVLKAMSGLNIYLAKSPIEQSLFNLVSFRVSQINGCAYCLDMHSKDLRAEGEHEQRLYVLDAWQEAPFYSDRERAALSWAEAVTKCDVPGEIYEDTRKQFSEDELIDLTMAVVAINSYNRLNVTFRTTAGSYQPGQFATS